MLKRVLRTVWIIAGLSFTLWLYIGFQATGEAEAAALGNDAIDVMTTEGALQFRPRTDVRPSAVILLPRGMVEPVAYAPLLSAIATAGYPVRLIYLPMRCACTESQRAELFRRIQRVLDTEPGTRWIIAGHSRGGMLSARFVHENNPALAGL